MERVPLIAPALLLCTLGVATAGDPAAAEMAAMASEARAALDSRLEQPQPPAQGIAQGLREALSGTLRDATQLADLASRMERDWAQRPEWADMAIALLRDEGIAPGVGWFKPSQRLLNWDWLRERFDRDHDDCIAADELASAAALPEFDRLASLAMIRLDRDRSGFITAGDLDATRRPEPGSPDRTAAALARRADSDSNGRVSADEWLALHQQADSDGSGFAVAEDFARVLDPGPVNASDEMPPAQVLLTMLFTGQMGDLEEGPAVGALAPAGAVRHRGRAGQVKIADLVGRRPVVLVFGSFT